MVKFFSYVSERFLPIFSGLPKDARISHEKMATSWMGALSGEEFEKLRKDVFRIVISTYYQRRFGLIENKVELSVYDIARNEKDLIRLNKMNSENWRKVIHEMVMGSLEIMHLFENKKYKGKIHLKVALINIPILRRASFKIVS